MREKPVCLLTVDVEDWFHVIGTGVNHWFRQPIPTASDWQNYERRVVRNTEWILDTLDKFNLKATFFVLGWVAERHTGLVQEIRQRGHEIGCHGYWHKLIRTQTPEQFREDTRRSMGLLQNQTGEKVHGYRASSASITDWGADILLEEGITYDSSLYPAIHHDNYGRLTGTDDRKPIERLPNGLLEVKLSSLRLFKAYLPWSGGGWFRLYPYPVFKCGAKRILRNQGIFLFFIHPWEVDECPPRLDSLKLAAHFRRYVSIKRCRSRLLNLLSDFQFTAIYPTLLKEGFVEQ